MKKVCGKIFSSSVVIDENLTMNIFLVEILSLYYICSVLHSHTMHFTQTCTYLFSSQAIVAFEVVSISFQHTTEGTYARTVYIQGLILAYTIGNSTKVWKTTEIEFYMQVPLSPQVLIITNLYMYKDNIALGSGLLEGWYSSVKLKIIHCL